MKHWILLSLGAALLMPHDGMSDTVVLKSGERRTGTIKGIEGSNLLLLTQAKAGLPSLTARCPKSLVRSLEFEADAQRDALIQSGKYVQVSEIRTLWEELAPFLSHATSPTARIGLRLGLVLLQSGNPAHEAEAEAVFLKIAEEGPSIGEREAAQQGKLRLRVQQGRHEEAVLEAQKVASSQPGPSLLAEAHLILGGAKESELRKHLSENPRWVEDSRAAGEHARLYQEALDYYVSVSVLPEVAPELAVRGLWGALNIHKLCGEESIAAETAKDLVTFFPSSSLARKAEAYLSALPPEILNKPAPKPSDPVVDTSAGDPNEKSHEIETATASVGDSSHPSASGKKRKRSNPKRGQEPIGSLP